MANEKAKLGTNQRKLNHSSPAASKAKLGDTVADLVAQVNALSSQLAALTTKYNATQAKLDAANVAGMGTNNVATNGVPAFTATTVKDLESR